MASPHTEDSGDAFHLATTYEYKPLALSSTQFHIFTLQPSSDKDAPLEGTLRIDAFHGKDGGTSPYEALSYVWGTQVDATPLIFAGGTTVRITQNLAEALRHIRHPTRPRDLWIDALCIDQSNALEKNHQVRQMYQVFALASRVIIWLGLADEDSEYALTHLDSLNVASRRSLNRIGTLLQRPWSARVWTFQEGLAANADSIVMCGSTIASWHNVLLALKEYVHHMRNSSADSTRRLRYYLEVHHLHKTSQKMTLDRLILASSNRRATDPRDYIYALLGLVNDDNFGGIDPNYAQPASWTFLRAMFSIFESSHNLNALVFSLIRSEPTRLDSDDTMWGYWSLNAMQRHVLLDLDELYLNLRLGVLHGGAADGRSVASISNDLEQGTINLSGTIVGSIRECYYLPASRDWSKTRPIRNLRPGTQYFASPILDLASLRRGPVEDRLRGVIFDILELHIPSTAKAALEQWEQTSSSHVEIKLEAGHVWKLLANGRHMEHLLNEAPVPDTAFSQLKELETLFDEWLEKVIAYRDMKYKFTHGEAYWSAFDEYQLREDFEEWLDWTYNPSTGLGQHESLAAGWKALYRIAADFSEDCVNIFTVSGGYIGSSYGCVKPDDIMCILFGSKVPLVMRQDQVGHYRIVGAVYVDGLMGGEFFKDGKEYTTTEFVIK